MKAKKELVIIILLLVAFIAFFINAMVVLGQKDSQILRLQEEKDKLRKAYSALESDLKDLRSEKVQLMKKLDEAHERPVQVPEKEDSTRDK